MSGVIKKAEEGAKAAKSKLLKEQIEEEQVMDPDDPQMFAEAYKKNHWWPFFIVYLCIPLLQGIQLFSFQVYSRR